MMWIAQSTSKPEPTVLAALFIVTLLPLYYGSWQYRTAYARHRGSSQSRPMWSEDFIDTWLDTHLIDPFDPYPLQAYCNLSTWRPELVFNLDDANGGIGNVRGNVLDFLLYAIEAGASIILPSRASRSGDDLGNVWASRASFETFFDEEWFSYSMDLACPQMTIYRPEQQRELVSPLVARYQPPGRRVDDNGKSRAAYLEDINAWLNEQGDYNRERLTVINVGRTLWDFDTRSLPYGVRRALGQVLNTSPDARHLAAKVVQSLASRFLLDIKPSQPIPKQAFMGAHLRTESDAAQAGWLNAPNTNFSAQSDAYMKHAAKHKLKIIYVASGNATELERFKEKAARHTPPLNITSKLDLLGPGDLERLNNLTWDQQALVDYEVLQRSSVFGGFVRSSFSYNIALTRHQWLEDQGRVIDPWFVMHSEDGVAFDDGISRIIGRDDTHERRIPRGMWP